MTPFLKLNYFSIAANQACFAPVKKYLRADFKNLIVEAVNLPLAFTCQEITENQQTWRVFQQTLLGTIGKEKFDWICKRYKKNVDFKRLQAGQDPLLPKHIELFSIGTSQTLTKDLKRETSKKIKNCTRKEITEKIQKLQPIPGIGFYKNPVKIGGAPSHLWSYFVHDRVLMDKEKQLLFSDVGRLSREAWLERMCKATVNREFIEGQVIPIAGENGNLDYYKIYKKISAKGLIAYAFRPAAIDSALSPLIVFRPTQWAVSNKDAFATYFNDAQRNIGKMGWKAAESMFEELVADPKFRSRGKHISIAGYSLGGAHAQYFLNTHAKSVDNAVFYADPSVNAKLAEQFAEKVHAMPKRNIPLKLQIFRVAKDFFHYVGEKHIGWGVNHPDVQVSLTEVECSLKTAGKRHAYRIFDNNSPPISIKVFKSSPDLLMQLDNPKRGAEVLLWEKTRHAYRKLASYSLYSVSKAFELFSLIFGIRILRSSS